MLLHPIFKGLYVIYFQILSKTIKVMLTGLLGGNNITVSDWTNFCRDVCTTYLLRNPTMIGKNELFPSLQRLCVISIDFYGLGFWG